MINKKRQKLQYDWQQTTIWTAKNGNINDKKQYKQERQKRVKNEINHSVILSRALLCVSQSIIVCETWDPMEMLSVPRGSNSSRSCTLQREKIFREYDDLWQAKIVEMHPYSRFNKGRTFSFSQSLTFWASTRGLYRSRVKVEARRITLSPR